MKKFINIILYILFINLSGSESKKLITPGGPENKDFIIKIIYYGEREGQEDGFIEKYYLSDPIKLKTCKEKWKMLIRNRMHYQAGGAREEGLYADLYVDDMLSINDAIGLKQAGLKEVIWDVTDGYRLQVDIYSEYRYR